MNTRSLPLKELADVAIQAAEQAGEYIRSVDRTQLEARFKEAGSTKASQLVTAVDLKSEAIIREKLQPSCDSWDIAFVGEESTGNSLSIAPDRSLNDYFWCVDPLDGTLPFVEGRPGYAISIALVDPSGIPLLGVVYDPVEATLLHAIKGQSAHQHRTQLRGRASTVASRQSLMVFADESFKTQRDYVATLEILEACSRHFGVSGVEVVYGSGAVKNACQVLKCPSACYVKLPKPEEGGGSIWDFAATACIVREAGGWVSDVYGDPLELNPTSSTFMNRHGVVYASSEDIGRYIVGRFSLAAAD